MSSDITGANNVIANSFVTTGSSGTISGANNIYANTFIGANAALIAGINVVPYLQSAFTQANSAYNQANNSLPLAGGTITGDLSVSGNLTILGTQTTINTTSIVLNDPLLYLANNNYSSDLLDIGIIGHYNSTANAHTGVFRDPNRKEWIFFEGYTPEVGSNNLINIADPSFAYANVYANTFKGNLIANNI